MNKILVTGGTGMLGMHLKKILPTAIYVGSKDYDLTDLKDTKKLLKKVNPTHVIHLAAKVGGIQDNVKCPADYYDDNILINTNILKTCKKYNVKRFTGILSTCIYPNIVKKYPMSEEDLFNGPPPPSNFSYAYAKRCLAVQIDAYNKQFGTKYNYLIPCNLYGDYDNLHNENKMHFVTALLNKIRNSQDNLLHLLGTGRPLRQFMYAGDLARVIKEVIDRDIVENFNVAPNYNYSINEMANIAKSVLNVDLKIKYSKPELDGQYRKDVSCKKMRHLLPNFNFTTFEEGVKKVYNSIINE